MCFDPEGIDDNCSWRFHTDQSSTIGVGIAILIISFILIIIF